MACFLVLRCLVTIAVFGFVVRSQEQEPLWKKEKELKTFLLSDYDLTVTPNADNVSATELQFGMALVDIEHLDEDKGILTTHVWIRSSWTDKRLSWEPSEHGGLEWVAIPARLVWRPDLVPYNNAMDDFHYSADYNAIVQSDGTVLFIPHMRLKTRCSLTFKMYPFDEQHCKIKMGSWVYSSNDIIMKEGFSGFDLNDYIPNGQWDLVNHTSKINTKFYPCCKEGYYDFTANMVLRRHANPLMHLYIGPAVSIGLTIPVVFTLPVFSTFKFIVGGSLLISQVMVTSMFTQSLPANHLSVPLIALYLWANIVLLLLSLICSSIVISCWNRAKRAGPGVPNVVDKIFLGIFGRILCVKRDTYIDDSDGGVPSNSVPANNTDMQIDDSATMVKEYTRLVAPAEWRQLAVVLDRLLFVIFLVITVVFMAVSVRNKY